MVGPRGALAEGVRHPAPLVGQPALQGDPPVGAVDPVPGEGARTGQLDVARAVRAQRDGQGGPHQRRLPADVRRVRDRARQRQRRAPADRLHEPHRPVLVRRLGPQHRERRGPEGGADLADPDRGRPHHEAASRVEARVDDPAVLDLGPDREQVREPELVVAAQLVQLVGAAHGLRQRLVPVREAQVHPGLECPVEGVGRDPGHRRDGCRVAHAQPPGRDFRGTKVAAVD